jgi:divalent metal cation (Fe/Co/Zn/Cd) transporter
MFPASASATDRPDDLAAGARLAAWTIAYLASAGAVLFFVVGESQGVKSAWLETAFSIVSPIVFLAGSRIATKPPDGRYPFGYYRFVSLGYLGAATALFGCGVYLVADAGLKAAGDEAPSLGTVVLMGREVWLGWPALAALAWSAVPAWLIGRIQIRRARRLHDKLLYADAAMRSADWQSALAAGIGIAGLELGAPWLDVAAGGLIGAAVLYNGIAQLRAALSDLADSAPTTVDGEPDPLPDRIRECLMRLDWAAGADVRMREEGRVLFGDATVWTRCAAVDVAGLATVVASVRGLDPRIRSFVLMPLPAAEAQGQAVVEE